MQNTNWTRRDWLKTGAAALAAGSVRAAEQAPRGKADACVFLWLGGGAAHIDTFDPKVKGDGRKNAGSYYAAIDSAIRGVKVCEHLKRTAPLLDRCAPIRSLTHDIVSEHG